MCVAVTCLCVAMCYCCLCMSVTVTCLCVSMCYSYLCMCVTVTCHTCLRHFKHVAVCRRLPAGGHGDGLLTPCGRYS